MRHHSIHRSIAPVIVLSLAIAALALPESASAVTAKQLAAQLVAVKAEVAGAGGEYDRAQARIEDTDYRLAMKNRRLKQTLKDLRGQEKVLSKRADAMYRSGDQTDVWNFILGAQSFDDLVTRMDYMDYVARRDANIVRTIKRVRVRLRDQKAELKDIRKRRVSEAREYKAKLTKLQSKLASTQSRYNSLMVQLQAAMIRERMMGNVTYMPKNIGGMVFPVQGPHYYANTFGAPRSGGRRHKGTDIMANRGVPCVAVVAGTVNAHYNSLGGNSITLTGSGMQFYYAHLDRYVVRGGRVKAGQVIGTVGSTGNASGGAPHLHFQMGHGGNWVNPYPYLRAME